MMYLGKKTHIQEDDLQMYVLGRLEPGRASAAESHLTDCEACRKSLSQCVGMRIHLHYTGETERDQKQKRTEPRFVTGDDAILQELNPLSLERQKVRILDVSKHGLGVLIPKSLFRGTIVQIRIRENVELGEVRHCRAWGGDGYRIGLRLVNEI